MARARGRVRAARRHQSNKGEDFRTPFQRDRDRVLHAAEFRRLVGITQVVGPHEGPVFHNRLTHTVEVAQIGRRIAERLVGRLPMLAEKGYLVPDVVEAAALVHDLGHPPFGHTGEKTLDVLSRLALSKTDEPVPPSDFDGFEGNAQSFRIVCRLALHDKSHEGLNLTRATLAATLKYPWFRADSGQQSRKFGAYRSEADDLRFAGNGSVRLRKSLEAEIMDYADDVAYSVNDLLDFYQAGLIPLDRLVWDQRLLSKFVEDWTSEIEDPVVKSSIREAHQEGHFRDLLTWLVGDSAFDGRRRQRAHLREVASQLISEYVLAFEAEPPRRGRPPVVQVSEEKHVEILFLKRLVWVFIIASPRLATQQVGQREALRVLFTGYLRAVHDRDEVLIPKSILHEVEGLGRQENDFTPEEVRLAVDVVASLTDGQALALFRRMAGIEPGSVMDLIEQ